MEHIRHSLVINAPIQKVYDAVTQQIGLSDWWTKETVAKAEIGFINEFKFGDRYFNKMKVVELKPNTQVKWQCLQGDEEWVNTFIHFDMKPEEQSTILRFAHKNWREATEFYERCNYNWGYYLYSLKLLCETGKGKPFS